MVALAGLLLVGGRYLLRVSGLYSRGSTSEYRRAQRFAVYVQVRHPSEQEVLEYGGEPGRVDAVDEQEDAVTRWRYDDNDTVRAVVLGMRDRWEHVFDVYFDEQGTAVRAEFHGKP